jgi:hypothetical protein
MSQKIEGEHRPPDVLKEGIDSGLLPRISETAAPAMDKDHRVVL